MTTFFERNETVARNWYIVDASQYVLGRLASEVAHRLRGKHKAEYTPHVDTGDNIIVINAEKIKMTGNKRTDKLYQHHTGYPGGLKTTTFEKLLAKSPERVIMQAVKGMLPRNPLGRATLKKLKVYAGSEHPHIAQQPEAIVL